MQNSQRNTTLKQSIERLIGANLNSFPHQSDDKVAERTIRDIDETCWREVLFPLVRLAVHSARRERDRANEEKLRLMPLVTEQAKSIPEPEPSEGTARPVPLPSAPTRPGSTPNVGVSVRKPFNGQVLNRDLVKWLRDRRDVLDTRFSLGDGREVTFALATIDEHGERAEMLRRTIAGTHVTLDLHERCIANLAATGAENMAALMKGAAA